MTWATALARLSISAGQQRDDECCDKRNMFFQALCDHVAPGHARQCSKTKFRAAESLGLLLLASDSHSSIEFAILLCGEGWST